MSRIGIDFGTSYCTASWINPTTGMPEAVIFNETGMSKMPSIVYYPKDEDAIVGQSAKNQLDNCFKMEEQEKRKILPFIIRSVKRVMRQNSFFFKESGERVSHVEVIADILRKIREEAEMVCFGGESVDEVVLTHPVIFESWKKNMLKSAAELAGFTQVTFLEEPIAAALGYLSNGLQKGENVLVYDFGGGTFDVAFVQYDEGCYRIPIEPDGDPFCGGDDIDKLIYDCWEQLAIQKYNHPLNGDKKSIDIAFLQQCCLQKEKISISGKKTNEFNEIFFLPNFCRMTLRLTNEEFNNKIAPVVDKTIKKTEILLKKIKDKGYRIDKVVMIGGSSRLPLVAERLRSILPIEPLKVMQVDTAVALGAVVQIEMQTNRELFCMYCGKKINSKDQYCMFCGKQNQYFIGDMK